jgi:hypothetical protein
MRRPEQLAKFSRLIRLQGEADSAVRDLRELQTKLEALVREERS